MHLHLSCGRATPLPADASVSSIGAARPCCPPALPATRNGPRPQCLSSRWRRGLLLILASLNGGSPDLPAATVAPDPPRPTATAVFARYFDAVGGRSALEAVSAMRVRGLGQEGESTLRFEFTFQAPGRLLFIGRVDGQVLVRMGRDARARCWRQDPGGVRDLDDRQAGELMDLALALNPPAVYGLSHLLESATCERQVEDGRETIALGRATPPSAFPRLVFDPGSGRMIQAGTVTIEDYRPVGALQIPRRVRDADRSVFEVEDVELNPFLADASFEKPQVRTSMSERAQGPSLELTNLCSAVGKLEIVRHPAPANFGRGQMLVLPAWNQNSSRHAQVDLRGYDLTRLDLNGQLTNLLHADFDSRTRWPDRLPAGFDRERILSLGRDPGLGVRGLHRRGITGRGVGLGIIDQPLLVDHVEYRDRLRLYEEIHSPAGAPAQMHGPAVASIAAGRSTGVAPEAEIYYIAEQHGVYAPNRQFEWDFTPLARSIDRLLDVNSTLPPGRRIRVISISVGWSPDQKGYAEAMAAVRRADAAGVFVVSTALEETHHLSFHGLGREALADPNDFGSYGPGSWWAGLFWGGQQRFTPGGKLLVPMDCRGVASPTGPEDYVFYYSAGWSWSVPWIAGLYALACQVQPEITPTLFWARALETGRTVRVRHGADECDFGTVADPIRLLESLQTGAAR
jgi:hypothetical protein